MATSFTEIHKQAQALNTEERAQLADAMLASLETELSDIQTAWAHEIEARVAALDAGKMETVNATDVFAEAQRLGH